MPNAIPAVLDASSVTVRIQNRESYLVQNGTVPKLVYNGSKIMMMHLGKGYDIRILDSANFLPMRLAALPKAFGLMEQAKGYYPHFFNKTENWNYRGPYPSIEDYGIDSMSSTDREIFLRWYQSRTDEFDFQEHMLLYCMNDVQLLREVCIKFRQLLLGITGEMVEQTNPETLEVKRGIKNGVDPLAYITIALVCMNVFRRKFLMEKYEIETIAAKEEAIRHGRPVEKTEAVKKRRRFFLQDQPVDVAESNFLSSPLAMIPAGGYVACDQYSKLSIQWIELESHKRGIQIRHTLNECEVRFPAPSGRYYKLDGFYIDPVTEENVCLEYNSCVHHRCLCQDRVSMDPYNKQTMAQQYTQTVEKLRILEDAGIKVVTKWDHKFRRELKSDPELSAFVDTLDLEEQLEPRDTFFEGCTNAVNLYRKAEEGEKIKYVDFTSLYPTVNKYDRYPVGHPIIATAHVRLRLYNVLDRLREKVLNFDTDSVIYVVKNGEDKPGAGDFLGDLADELNGKHITEFVSASPKNYTYLLNNGDTQCKVKGFTLNHENAKKINFWTMCSEVFLWHFHGATMGTKLENPCQICRDAKKRVYNRAQQKSYSVVYDKRRIINNLNTVPYGYVD